MAEMIGFNCNIFNHAQTLWIKLHTFENINAHLNKLWLMEKLLFVLIEILPVFHLNNPNFIYIISRKKHHLQFQHITNTNHARTINESKKNCTDFLVGYWMNHILKSMQLTAYCAEHKSITKSVSHGCEFFFSEGLDKKWKRSIEYSELGRVKRIKCLKW